MSGQNNRRWTNGRNQFGITASVTIVGLGKPVSSRIDAVLHVVEKDGEKRTISFPAKSVMTDTKGSGLKMEFPSLIPWRLYGKKGSKDRISDKLKEKFM